MDAKQGAYLYAGFKDSLSIEDYKRKVADGTICDTLAKHEVRYTGRKSACHLQRHIACRGSAVCGCDYRIIDYKRPGIEGKTKVLDVNNFESIDNFEAELKKYISWYNTKRIKFSLIGMSPVQYRAHPIEN